MRNEFREINVSTSTKAISPKSILFCGDFCPIGRASQILLDQERTSPLGNFQPFIDLAGVSIANLEGPFYSPDSVPISKTGPSISFPSETAAGIASLGFSAFGLANNHILDYGAKSLLKTQEILKRHRIASFGAGNNSQLSALPYTFVLFDKSYAIIGAADKEFSAAGNNNPGAYSPTDAELVLQIVNLRKNYNHLILYYHCGNEYNRYPSPRLVDRCHLFVQAGASAVICHHSHVSGAIEIYKGAPIIYSLGNFIFDRGLNRVKDWYLGYALALTPTETGEFKIAVIPFKQFGISPTVTLLAGKELEEFSRFINFQQEIINDPILLEANWIEWCGKHKYEYIGRLMGMNRISKKIYKILKYPLSRLSRSRKLYIYNLINCAAHREVLLSLLSNTRDMR